MQKQTTTGNELQEPTDTSLICSTSAESLNATSLETTENIIENSMLVSHLGSEYNLNESSASMSGRIFVLSFTGLKKLKELKEEIEK